MILTGASSSFGLLGRDLLPSPSTGPGTGQTNSALDADFLNRIADALIKIELYGQTSVVVDAANTAALCTAVQCWEVVYPASGSAGDPRASRVGLILPLAFSFLEDSGLIPLQNDTPDNPKASLAKSTVMASPRFVPLPVPLPLDQGNKTLDRLPLSTPVQPAWAGLIRNAPLFRTAVRLLGATGTQVFHLDNFSFFDAGDGVSPRLQADLLFSLPSLYGTTVPDGTYEISLLVMNWIH